MQIRILDLHQPPHGSGSTVDADPDLGSKNTLNKKIATKFTWKIFDFMFVLNDFSKYQLKKNLKYT